jgi:hypothetical protein
MGGGVGEQSVEVDQKVFEMQNLKGPEIAPW